ncbi:MAG: 4-hydroxyphenylpyruvate dioxygenase [Cyanobacteria bacterium P01_H01_bin.15]
MDFDHVHFFVEEAAISAQWFAQRLNLQWLGGLRRNGVRTEYLANGGVRVALSSAFEPHNSVATYLTQHPPGVGDLAFQVEDLSASIRCAIANGATLIQPTQRQGPVQWAIVSGYQNALQHTLIENKSDRSFWDWVIPELNPLVANDFGRIDHSVLNVPLGELQSAIAWYQSVFGLQARQQFQIQTPNSGLCSQVLVHPSGPVCLPINEPTCPNSQIHEFLLHHRGPGIQHLALSTHDLLTTVPQLRRQGLHFLPVPADYYFNIRSQISPQFPLPWSAIAEAEILLDCPDPQSSATLLQIFTQPIFGQPTFFFELIERRAQAQGFGERNFQALFEAIEAEQLRRTQALA